MCIICVDFQKERMTLTEAKRAFGEMVETLDREHADEVRQMLSSAELAQQTDDD